MKLVFVHQSIDLVFEYLYEMQDMKELVLKTMEGIQIGELDRAKREIEKSLVDLVSEELNLLPIQCLTYILHVIHLLVLEMGVALKQNVFCNT